MENLTNTIRRYRFDNGEMTQRQLAKRVGVSRQTMNAIENGRHAPTVSVAIRIADVFQTSVDKVFDLDYDTKPVRKKKVEADRIDMASATVDVPIDVSDRPAPSEKLEERQIGLASLRDML